MTEPGDEDLGYEDLFARALAEGPATLSAVGRVRRAEMRTALLGAVVARRRRRQVRRGFALVAAAVLVGGLAVLWPRGSTAVSPGVARAPVSHGYEVVATDPSVLARYAVASPPVPAEVWIDDAELLALLAGADRRTGLIRTGARVMLTAEVVDPSSE